MKKSLVISAKFDTSDFDKSVAQMQQKLKDIYAPSDAIRMQSQTASRLGQLGMGMNSPANPGGEQATLRARKDLNGFIKEEFQKQEALVKTMTMKDDWLKKQLEKQKAIIKGSKEELEIKEKIARVENEQSRNEAQFRQRNEAINQAAKMKESIMNTRFSEYGSPGGDFAGAMNKFGGPGRGPSISALLRATGIVGAMGTAIGVGGEMYGDYTRSPQRTAGNLGQGVQGTIGQESQIIGNRRSAFEAAFNPERSRAAQMALEANRGRRIETGAGIVGNILGYGAAGASAGAAGTALGGPLTALGGAAVGGIGGLGVGAYKAMNDPAQRAMLMSNIPGSIGKRYGSEYESIMTKQLGEDYQKSLQDLKNQNPGKTLASGYYEQNYMGNLQAQRGMGMGNEQFYGQGGFLQSGVNAGFTPEMMMQSQQGILGAGGSSRSAAGNSVFSNQLQRGMDLTNANQVLGTISGGVGGADASRQATIKILAEGMKLGLDDSKFAEENRRFAQTAAEIISRSGANQEGDFGRVAGGFGKFVAENTVQGVGAAKTAYEQYQQISSTTTGPRGVMRAAGFLSDPILGKMSTIEKQALMQIPENELNENNPMISGLAEKYGVSPDEMVKRMTNVNQGAVSRFEQADKLRDKLRSRNVDIGRLGDKKYSDSLPSQDRIDAAELMSYQTTELGYQGVREMTSRAAGTVNGKPVEFGPGIAEGITEGRLATGKGRGEDTTIAETAKDFGIVLQNFRDFRKEIMPGAEAIANFTGKVREMLIVLGRANEKDIPDIIKTYTQQRAVNQTQTGKTQK